MSKPHYHAVIWIDHREARVFHFNQSDVEQLVLHSDNAAAHIHHKANSIGSGHAAEDQHFLHEVIAAVSDASSVLVCGPGHAKTELLKHIVRHDPKMIEVIAGIETVDHPTDSQLVAHARSYFRTKDRM